MRDIEIGPIRPPSESNSLLIRVTRGCHWNKCYFCGLYKSMRFSMRPIDETIEDIRQQAQLNQGKKITSCFLQDGDALVLKTDYLLRILEAINQGFPDMQYITSYARADSITRKSPAELKALRQAGLNHLYSGMETGSDRILKLINKGFDVDTVVKSGCMAKEADMILSEFILLGIGGKELSEENAVQTAMALNIIQPDFIRVHATGIKPESKLGEFVRDGSFTLQSEEEIVVEQKLFLQQLHEMDSYYVNEHMLKIKILKGLYIMDFITIAKQRMSVRDYKETKVEPEKLEQILEAAHVAPTAANLQPIRLIAVQSEEGLAKIGKAANIYGAPLAIIVCADHDKAWVRPFDQKQTGDIDASILTDHMMLQATELGLGTVWVCYFDPAVLRKEFDLPANLEPVNILVIGYSNEGTGDPNRFNKQRIPMSQLVSYETL